MSFHSPDLFDAEPPAGFDGKFIWDYLSPAFQEATGRKITPMDIDAHVEIGGHHLVIETKRPNVDVQPGQAKALAQLWAKGYHTIIFLWGKEDPMYYCVWYPSGRRTPWPKVQEMIQNSKIVPVTRQELFDICKRWALWAERKPCPFQYDGRYDDGP